MANKTIILINISDHVMQTDRSKIDFLTDDGCFHTAIYPKNMAIKDIFTAAMNEMAEPCADKGVAMLDESEIEYIKNNIAQIPDTLDFTKANRGELHMNTKRYTVRKVDNDYDIIELGMTGDIDIVPRDMHAKMLFNIVENMGL